MCRCVYCKFMHNKYRQKIKVFKNIYKNLHQRPQKAALVNPEGFRFPIPELSYTAINYFQKVIKTSSSNNGSCLFNNTVK